MHIMATLSSSKEQRESAIFFIIKQKVEKQKLSIFQLTIPFEIEIELQREGINFF